MNETTLTLLEAHGLLPEVPFYGAEIIEFPPPQRVAFAGCWHARHDLIPEAMRAAKDAGADAIIHTGDFLYTGPAASKALMAMEEAAVDLGLFVVAVRGNHDDPAMYKRAATSTRRRRKHLPDGDPFARLSPHVLHAPNGTRWTWHEVDFVALGGAFSVDRAARVEGVSYWAGEVVSPRDVGAVKRGGHANVMITHDIPHGAALDLPTQRPAFWDMEGAERHRHLLRTAVDAVRPDWVVGGHMHLRQTSSIWLDGGHQVQVEVLDRVEAGVGGNLMVADLRDGHVLPA